MSDHPLAREWAVLQTQCASYDTSSLVIKLVATVLVGLSLLLPLMIPTQLPLLMALIVGILWLQEAIWRTFAQRIEARILVVERELAASSDDEDGRSEAFQLHTNFHTQRQQGGTVKQYFSQIFRPTVAFPYVALLAVLGVRYIVSM